MMTADLTVKGRRTRVTIEKRNETKCRAGQVWYAVGNVISEARWAGHELWSGFRLYSSC